MDTKHITGMLKALQPVIKDRQKAQILLERYWQTRIALVWTVQDGFRAANEIGVAVSRSEAQNVLQGLQQRHNRQYGLKWADLTDCIKDQVLGRPLTKPELRQFVHRDILTINK